MVPITLRTGKSVSYITSRLHQWHSPYLQLGDVKLLTFLAKQLTGASETDQRSCKLLIKSARSIKAGKENDLLGIKCGISEAGCDFEW